MSVHLSRFVTLHPACVFRSHSTSLTVGRGFKPGSGSSDVTLADDAVSASVDAATVASASVLSVLSKVLVSLLEKAVTSAELVV